MLANAAVSEKRLVVVPDAMAEPAQAPKGPVRWEYLQTLKAEHESPDLDKRYREIDNSCSLLAAFNADFIRNSPVKIRLVKIDIKLQKEAEYKANTDYRGNTKRVTDLVRLINLVDPKDIPALKEYVSLCETVAAIKDMWARPAPTGLRIANIKAQLQNGEFGELQFGTPYMWEAMQLSHDNYKRIQALTRQFRTSILPPDIAKEIKRLENCDRDSHETGAYLDGLDRFLDRAPS